MKATLPIEADPEIMSGAPVFRGTRVPVQSLFEYLEDDISLDKFLECFSTVRREGRRRSAGTQRERAFGGSARVIVVLDTNIIAH